MFYNRKIIVPLLFLLISIILFLIVNKNNKVVMNNLNNKFITRNLSIDELNEVDNNFLNEKISSNKDKSLDINNYYNNLYKYENFSELVKDVNILDDNRIQIIQTPQQVKETERKLYNKNKTAIDKYEQNVNNFFNDFENIFNKYNESVKLIEKKYWMISTDHKIYYVNSREITDSRKVVELSRSNYIFVDIAASTNYLWALRQGNTGRTLLRRKMPCEDNNWVTVPIQLDMIDCDSNYIIGVDSGNNLKISNANDDQPSFKQIDTNIVTCTAGNPTYYFAIDSQGRVIRYLKQNIINLNNIKGENININRTTVPENVIFKNISADKNHLWVVGNNKNLYSCNLNDFNPKWENREYMGIKVGNKVIPEWHVNVDNHIRGGLINYINTNDLDYITVGDPYNWFYKFNKKSIRTDGRMIYPNIEPSDWIHYFWYDNNNRIINGLKIVADKNDNYENIGIQNKPSYYNSIINSNNVESCIDIDINKSKNEILNMSKDKCNSKNECTGFSVLIGTDEQNKQYNLMTSSEKELKPRVCFTHHEPVEIEYPFLTKSQKKFYRKPN